MSRVVVCSRSFSRHTALKAELTALFPDAKFNDAGTEFSEGSLIEFLKDADMAIIGLEKVTANVLAALPKLKVISKYGVGLDTLDLDSMRARGVKLGWSGGVNRRSVAELTLVHMLSALRLLPELQALVKAGGWNNKTGSELSGKCVGLLGFGFVGQEVARLLSPFGCTLLAHDLQDKSSEARALGVALVKPEELFSRADILSLHIPLNADNFHLVGEKYLNLMKPSSILINTARGGLVDEVILADFLVKKKLRGAAFDVLETEPPAKGNQLVDLDNFYVSPHIGGSTTESILAMGRAAIIGLTSAALP